MQSSLRCFRFQSTLPHGSDEIFTAEEIEASIFQSTLPHGSDIDNQFRILQCYIFQSTLPHGSDYQNVLLSDDDLISIHAPSRERHRGKLLNWWIKQFQSTLPHGSDPLPPPGIPVSCDFNPRSLTGATLIALSVLPACLFQSTLPHGSDMMTSPRISQLTDFNPRSLTGATI